MNACYEITSVVLKVDGEYISCMPNNTIMDTGVPNWKSEAAIYMDGSDIRIEAVRNLGYHLETDSHA